MLNKKLNLSLKLNKLLSNVAAHDGPFTPLEQTLRTPLDAPHATYFPPQPVSHQPQGQPQFHQLYSNPQYNELDDILTDIDEPAFGSFKTTRNYTVNFTHAFDQLVMGVYSRILSLPTTTPFLGAIPPSGLVSKVANETMAVLVAASDVAGAIYDQHAVLSVENLRNSHYQPIFLQLIRKRLLDLCLFNGRVADLGLERSLSSSTSISITVAGGNGQGTNASIYNTNTRQTSILNLPLTDLNISAVSGSSAQARSRLSSMSLRKQSLTRNNSYLGSNWLHIGNLNNIRPTGNADVNMSTDLLQLMQDFVPQSFINRLAAQTSLQPPHVAVHGAHSAPQPPPQTLPFAQGHPTATTPTNGFNAMMMDYQTPPSSSKGLFSMASTPLLAQLNIQIVLTPTNTHDIDDFQFTLRSRLSSRGNGAFPHPLTINTEHANIQAPTLDLPFMLAATPLDDYSYFMSCAGGSGGPAGANQGSLSSLVTSTSSQMSSFPIPESPAETLQDSTQAANNKINLPNQFSLSEKKRDSLKLKRGIH